MLRVEALIGEGLIDLSLEILRRRDWSVWSAGGGSGRTEFAERSTACVRFAAAGGWRAREITADPVSSRLAKKRAGLSAGRQVGVRPALDAPIRGTPWR